MEYCKKEKEGGEGKGKERRAKNVTVIKERIEKGDKRTEYRNIT